MYDMNTPICQNICVEETKLADVFSSGASCEITVKLIGKSAPEAKPVMINPANSISNPFANTQMTAPIA